MNLFQNNYKNVEPLAYKLRPKNLDDFVGQEKLLGKDGVIRRLILNSALSNSIFYGPPGCGKSSLGEIISNTLDCNFEKLNATTASVSDIRTVVETAKRNIELYNKRTILFLDEIGEFEGKTLETLRQPLEDGKIVISRANFSVTYPVKNITITASNPTPSGYFPDNPLCSDSLKEIKRYQKKFSGPLLDRMDLYVEMHQLKKDEIFDESLSEKSKDIQERVIKAREIQKQRFNSNTLNRDMNKKQLNKYCKIDKESQEIMKAAIDNLKLSVRMFDKILKISRTIADLDGQENIKKEHLLEALNYRKKQ